MDAIVKTHYDGFWWFREGINWRNFQLEIIMQALWVYKSEHCLHMAQMEYLVKEHITLNMTTFKFNV